MDKHLMDWLQAIYDSLSRVTKRRLLIFIDIVLFFLAIACAFYLRFNLSLSSLEIDKYFWQILLLISLKLLIFHFKGMYRPILRYADLEFLSTVIQAVVYSSVTQVILSYLQGFWPLPRTVLIIDALLTLVFVVTVRMWIRSLSRELVKHKASQKQSLEKLIIYGAGVAGSQLARSLIHEPDYQIIGFIDDNPDLRYQVIMGFKVYSPVDLPKLMKKNPCDTVILAMPSIDKIRKREIINHLQNYSVFVKTTPTLVEILSNKVAISEIRTIDVAELLGREEVMPHPELLQMNVTGKSVLVTGAGGSIGSELCRQISQLEPKCLVLYELSEFSLYKIDMELGETYPHVKRLAYLGNVTDQFYLMSILKQHQIDTIYHAAAYKHVPLVEANPAQGVCNNVLGTLSTARAAIASNVKNFVLISTDKAVRPTNVMGASKRIAELLIQALAEQKETLTCFAIVRFGNVLDSSGSVVPRFRQQIARGQAITITHPDVTRYFMSIPEAVRLVIQAGAMASGGEVFLLDMGEPIRIYDLALQMICLSGLVPGRDIEIKFTGLRPGEKLYEELLIDGKNIRPTKHPKIFSAYEHKINWKILEPLLEELLSIARCNDHEGVINLLKELVPEYQAQTYFLSVNGPKKSVSHVSDNSHLNGVVSKKLE